MFVVVMVVVLFVCHWTASWFNHVLKSRKIFDIPIMPTFLCSNYLNFFLTRECDAFVKMGKDRWPACYHQQHVCCVLWLWSLGTSFLGKLGIGNQDSPCSTVCVGPVVCCCEHVQCKASLLISLYSFPGKYGGLRHGGSEGQRCLSVNEN